MEPPSVAHTVWGYQTKESLKRSGCACEGMEASSPGAAQAIALQVPMEGFYGLVGSSSAFRLVSELYGVLKQL